mgnify:CR=1 FL=1
MKKYSFILCIALVAFVVASCGLKGNHTSSGRAYELLVVVDHGVWDRAAGRALHDAHFMMCLIPMYRDCRSRNLLSGLCILHRKIMILR